MISSFTSVAMSIVYSFPETVDKIIVGVGKISGLCFCYINGNSSESVKWSFIHLEDLMSTTSMHPVQMLVDSSQECSLRVSKLHA